MKRDIENSIPYDDNKLEHILAGPDYGQPWNDEINEVCIIEWCINKNEIDEVVVEIPRLS